MDLLLPLFQTFLNEFSGIHSYLLTPPGAGLYPVNNFISRGVRNWFFMKSCNWAGFRFTWLLVDTFLQGVYKCTASLCYLLCRTFTSESGRPSTIPENFWMNSQEFHSYLLTPPKGPGILYFPRSVPSRFQSIFNHGWVHMDEHDTCAGPPSWLASLLHCCTQDIRRHLWWQKLHHEDSVWTKVYFGLKAIKYILISPSPILDIWNLF